MDTPHTRDTTLDIMRGLAVFWMVFGNMAGGLFFHPYPAWVQVGVAMMSFVPALFILIAGMMVVYTTVHKGYTFKHFLMRCFGLLFIAAVVLDIFIWGFVPFTGVEVLYLIAISLPIAYFFQRLGSGYRWVIIFGIFLITPFLQYYFGYTSYPTALSILTGQPVVDVIQTSVLQHWFIDGWFPIFPWLGFALLGVQIGLLRWKDGLTSFATKEIVFPALGLLFFGIFMWLIQAQELIVRGGFSEAIYPPTIAYALTATGEILLLFAVINWKTHFWIYKPLIVFGQSALFMYIFHFVLIEFVWPAHSSQFVILSFVGVTLVLLFILGYMFKYVRRKYPKRPLVLRVLGI